MELQILKSGISKPSELVLNSRKHCLKMTMRFSVFKILDAGNFTFQIFSVSDQEIKSSRHCEHGTHGCCEEDPEVKVAVVLIDVQLGVKFSILKSGISNSSELVLNSRKHCLKTTM